MGAISPIFCQLKLRKHKEETAQRLILTTEPDGWGSSSAVTRSMYLHGIQMESIANQVVRQVPEYVFPSHTTVSALLLLQASLACASPAAVVKGVINMSPLLWASPCPKRNSWYLQQKSMEDPWEDTGAGCGLSGGVSQVRDPQSTITSWRKNLRSKHLPQMYPLFTGRWEWWSPGYTETWSSDPEQIFWVTLRKILYLLVFLFPKWKTEIAALPSFQQSKCIKDCEVMGAVEVPWRRRFIWIHLLCITHSALSFNLLLLSIIVI